MSLSTLFAFQRSLFSFSASCVRLEAKLQTRPKRVQKTAKRTSNEAIIKNQLKKESAAEKTYYFKYK
tara:strand:+ start:245 stop:445 length:201 start_codon:yes stop_codon:yes gene_type:complete